MKKTFLKFTSVASMVALTPVLVFAAQSGNPGQLTEVTTFLGNIVTFMNDTLVPVIFALAFLVFVWGMFTTFILGGADEDKQKEGRSLMMYAIIGFVLMVSLWGIVNLVADGFGFTGGTGPTTLPSGPSVP